MALRDERTEWLRVQIYRQMTPQERILIAAQMSEKFDERGTRCNIQFYYTDSVQGDT